MNTPTRCCLLIGLLAFTVSALSAQTTLLSATLTPGQEVPPSTFSSGSGSGTLQVNNSTGAWTLSGTFTNLYSPTNGAHIHGPAGPGFDAGVVAGINFTNGATSGTFDGSGTFTAQQMTELFAGLYYINIHTSFYPGGEIRGQLTPVPEPATYALAIGAAGLAVAVYRRRSARTRGPATG